MPAQPDLPVELTTELREVETLLQQFSPVESEINRDASLYAAGWAAALAHAPTRSHWLWPTTSAVLAASLLLLITLPTVPPASLLQRAGTEPQAPTKQAHTLTTTHPNLTQIPPLQIFTPPPRAYSPTAPMLTMRNRALRMEFNDPVSFTELDEDFTPKVMTARELMQELLGETS